MQRRQAEQASRIVMIDLLEHVTRQTDPTDLPVPLNRRGVLERHVRALEVAAGGTEKSLLIPRSRRARPLRAEKERRRFRAYAEVGAVQNAVLKLEEECLQRSGGMAPHLRD